MKKEITIGIKLTTYDSINEVSELDFALFENAREALKLSYSPYSNFRVGAAARLDNQEIVLGANQENASYPLCLCAERVLLATISSKYPNQKIESIAITASNEQNPVKAPVSPCGACRQVLVEKEDIQNEKFSLLLCGESGTVVKINSAKDLLPLSFDSSFL